MLPFKFRLSKEKTFANLPLLPLRPSAAVPAAMWANILDWANSSPFRALLRDSRAPNDLPKVAIKSLPIPGACKPIACAPHVCTPHACTAPTYLKTMPTLAAPQESFSSFRGRRVSRNKGARKLLRFFAAVCFCGFALAGLPLTVEGEDPKDKFQKNYNAYLAKSEQDGDKFFVCRNRKSADLMT
eukprot:GHVT01092024.1.p1 GENE.GHVT01092024.1~~GHVT01092024.1.p1  ORF type:complete len:185 (+),score=21.88 GHVT01092024.1:50-604(+)